MRESVPPGTDTTIDRNLARLLIRGKGKYRLLNLPDQLRKNLDYWVRITLDRCRQGVGGRGVRNKGKSVRLEWKTLI